MSDEELREIAKMLRQVVIQSDAEPPSEALFMTALRSVEVTTRMRCHREIQECAVRISSKDLEGWK